MPHMAKDEGQKPVHNIIQAVTLFDDSDNNDEKIIKKLSLRHISSWGHRCLTYHTTKT